MAYGIFVNYERPKSKKAITEAIANNANVILENTAIIGNRYDGLLDYAPDGEYTFVGPDPRTSRKYYGVIEKRDGKITVK